MKATIWTGYGAPHQVLKYGEVPKPSLGDTQVLVKVVAAAVHAGDWHVIRGDPFPVRLMYGIMRPSKKCQIPGMDVAGRVVAVGRTATLFKLGDEVYGDLSECGLGAFAEFVAVDEKQLAAKPASASFEQAAACPVSAVTALQALRDKGQVKAGDRVLVVGASGGVGSFAVQIAKSMGAHVTGVCSTTKIDMVRSLGADEVVDYKVEDVTKRENQANNSDSLFDCIIDAGAYRPFFDYAPVLSPRGRYILVGGSFLNLLKLAFRGSFWSRDGKQFLLYLTKPNVPDLQQISHMIGAGQLKPAISLRFPLAQVAEAITYMEEGKAQGKILINVEAEEFKVSHQSSKEPSQ